MANKRILVAPRDSLSKSNIYQKGKRDKAALHNHVKFVGPSILRSDEGFTLIASGNGEVTYGVPSFIK